MTMMLSPDLLDRRALALLRLVDPIGRPMTGPAILSGDGLRTIAKTGGRWAILAATGLETHVGAFEAPPATPALGSVACAIDIRPLVRSFAPRRVVVTLPRDPDPAHSGQADSVFEQVDVPLLPDPRFPIPATCAAVRVTVRKKGDGRRVANALVRVASSNGQFAAQSVSDAVGEALVIVPEFPVAFTGNGGALSGGLAAKVTAVADPASAPLVADDELAAARSQAIQQTRDFPDPAALAAAFAVPSAGANITLSVREVATTEVEWKAP